MTSSPLWVSRMTLIFFYLLSSRTGSKVIIAMVDRSIGWHVGVQPAGMLNIPMEVLVAAAGRDMRNPLVAGGIYVTPLLAPRRVLQPVGPRGHEGMVAPAGQKPPRVFYRPVTPCAQSRTPTLEDTIHFPMVPGASSLAVKSRPSACRKAISSVAM